MACNENVIKNMAGEVSRICQMKNVTIDVEFVFYLIELLLLNPKYGKLFKKTLNRNNLEFVVNDCVSMLTSGSKPININTLKMQFTMYSNYDKPYILQKKYLDRIESCLRPLVNEIIEEDPDPDEESLKKLYRKISIYIVLFSGLGNPSVIVTLKEGMAALESVFPLEDLQAFLEMSRSEKSARLAELATLVSGVRLFNRDCRLTGENIPDLPQNLVDAAKACIHTLSESVSSTMKRVNMVTSVIASSVKIDSDTGNAEIDVAPQSGLKEEDYRKTYDVLALHRQYEIFARRLLSDTKNVLESAHSDVARFEEVLSLIHRTTRYKAAVPSATVFPMFTDLWLVWRSMQCLMYVVSLINQLMQTLSSIQDQSRIPHHVNKILAANELREKDPNASELELRDKEAVAQFDNYQTYSNYQLLDKGKPIHFLGFCAVCINVGALVPCKMNVGVVRHGHGRYGACSYNMALKLAKDPQRYVNNSLDYVRNNPHLINLLNVLDDVRQVRDIENLATKLLPKKIILDKDIQTETHPHETIKDKNYSWDLWEWKRRACQWATITNCLTHSTQTNYSHLRSEIQCQTFEFRDKAQQTKKDCGINTNRCNYFAWGLRGQIGYGQHLMNLDDPIHRGENCLAKADSFGFFTQSFMSKSDFTDLKLNINDSITTAASNDNDNESESNEDVKDVEI